MDKKTICFSVVRLDPGRLIHIFPEWICQSVNPGKWSNMNNNNNVIKITKAIPTH